MCVRYLGFVLLVWFPGVLHAQRADNSCSAPRLNDGYFVPNNETYAHGVKLTYACEKGNKPVVAGRWWATSTCQNGTWFHEPKCIDEEDCITPEIPNANYTTSPEVWYQDGHVFRVTCNEGYEPKNRAATTRCNKGRWTSVLVCEKRYDSCGEPPRIPHAVIKHEYKEVFAADTQVYYECEDGYTVERAEDTKSIFCVHGNWTDSPTCRQGTGSDPGHDVSAEVETVGGDTTNAGSETQPGDGSSTNCGLNEHELTTINRCGSLPVVRDGVVVETDRMFVKYKCSRYYALVGPQTVSCYSDGTWSEVPTCKAAFCSVDTDKVSRLKPVGVKFIEEGETVRLECKDEHWFDNFSKVQCTNGKIQLSRCCNRAQLSTNTC
ncbi:complement factor H-like isoform X1 [Dicentrarchus labrax]|uniref:complement factor H-like isoform X1 n=1 Tax=Dicentrarchus labrax TaxID=13489 RepID=UPI0021F68A20|nr:complement factor H-like isoform X1 [Dicentrarchus labrax]